MSQDTPIPHIISQTSYAQGKPTKISIPHTLPATDGDQLAYTINHRETSCFHLTLRLDGRIDETRMARALRLTLDQEPVFGCRWISHWRKPYWQRRNDLDSVRLCTLVHTHNTMNSIQDYFAQPNNIESDLSLEMRIFREKTDSLCYKISHVATDAFGALELLAIIFQSYLHLKSNPNHQVEPNLSGDRSYAQIIKNFTWTERLKIMNRQQKDLSKRIFPLRKRFQLLSQDGPPIHPRFVQYDLTPEETQALTRLRKQHSVSLNSLLSAAYLRVLHHFIQPTQKTPIRLQHTVNLRRHLPHQKAGGICNLVGYSFADLGQEIGSNLIETSKKVQAGWEQLRDDFPGTGELFPIVIGTPYTPFALRQQIVRYLMTQGSHMLPPMLSTMDFSHSPFLAHLEQPVTEFFLIPVVAYPPLVVPSIGIFNGVLSLLISFCDNGNGSDIHDKILSGIHRELTNLPKEPVYLSNP